MLQEIKYGKLMKISNKENYKEFISKEESKKWGKIHYSDWGKKYTNLMKSVKEKLSMKIFEIPVESYCGNTYSSINRYLRNDIHSTSNYEREISDMLIIAIHSAPRIPNDIIVYRLVSDNFIQKLIENNKNGKHFTKEKGFISTSTLKSITELDERYTTYDNMLKIYVPKGMLGLYVNSVTGRKEEEILFPPNLDLSLIKYPYKDKETKKTIYECRLIDQTNLYDVSFSL